MRFLNLTMGTISDLKKYETQGFIIDDVEKLFKMRWSDAQEQTRKLLEPAQGNGPVLFSVEIQNGCDIEEFEILCDLITSCVLMNNNTKEEKEAEPKYKGNIPKELEEVNCTVMPLLISLNRCNINPLIGLHIYCGRKCKEKYVFDLINQEETCNE